MINSLDTKRDHGGNLDAAIAQYGGTRDGWLDRSTGINPLPYAVPAIPSEAWAVLPRKTDMARLLHAAQVAYQTVLMPVAFAGAQGAIQAVPFLRPAGQARVLAPTYNEHAAALCTGGWDVLNVPTPEDLAGADLAVVVNPNNPDGARYTPEDLRAIAAQVGLLIVDESFADTESGLSLAGDPPENTVILRSFGKFYGLAGLRLGFAIAKGDLAERLSELAGPWPISGPAIEIAQAALMDQGWAAQTIQRLSADAARLDDLAVRAGWELVGGTPLFRTYVTPDAQAAQDHLAHHQIWSRIFPYSPHWIRLGLPVGDQGWQQLEKGMPDGIL
jgi:cobalamin biosynthetic protein CobC